MNASLTTVRRLTTVALGAGAVAIGALAMGAPANADTCRSILRPRAFGRPAK